MKTVSLSGVPTHFAGDPNDTYFQELEQQAVGLEPLARWLQHLPLGEATALDVGANLGLSTILLARHARQVIAFEASASTAEYLQENLRVNGISNVDVIPAAVSDRIGHVRFAAAPQFAAGAHVVSVEDETTISIPTLRLDAMRLPPIALLKVDVEGHEPDVLAGAAQLLARDRPLIYCEINLWCLCAYSDHVPRLLLEKLWETFEVSVIGADGNLAPAPPAIDFLYSLIVHRQGVADIVLHPRAQNG